MELKSKLEKLTVLARPEDIGPRSWKHSTRTQLKDIPELAIATGSKQVAVTDLEVS